MTFYGTSTWLIDYIHLLYEYDEKTKFSKNRKSLIVIYISFIKDHYTLICRCSMGQFSQYDINETEKLQNEAARIVTGAPKQV